ncbi:hypothetical protein J4Q44_G00366540 [Coregonus suidteri]|uniref:DNA-dependent protein kinase catalytic subunit n=1 Tax=Coregonus suidteri TaxID=861788 RepID=A0AAN8KKD6_9TELE
MLPWRKLLPVAMVRKRVVRLLGHLGGQLNRNLVTATSAEEMMKKFVAWDSEKRLSFAVPFADMKPVIYLDPFLPRITELALSTSDRQTKVAACELLHSLVVYIVGKGSQMVEGEKGSLPMYNLHKRLFPVLLRLACDVDQITRQLFEPLVMQLIHWFTNNKKFESQDTVAVLEAIMDGVIDPVDSTLRDFCGHCVHEFIKWSIKQTTPKQQEKSPANIKSLFKRIYSLALHPNGFKRLGAALAFNSIYRLFREENSLVEQFVFEALVVFVESLALAHSDERSLGTSQQCGSAIDHLKRIIKHKASNLNQQNTKRRIPRGFPPDEKVCLSDVVMWLLEQCGRPQTECRHKCMELFYELVPLLPGKRSPSQWLQELLQQHGVGFLIFRLEGGGLLSQPTLRHLAGPFTVRAALQWMDLLLAALDCYNTFIGLHIIKPQQILGSDEKSSFLNALGFFLAELATKELEAAEGCFRAGQRISLFSPRERDQYNYSKCTIIVRLMEFATVVLVKCQQDFWKLLEKDLFDSAFLELVALTLCEPSSIGFNMADLEVMKRLPEVCVPLLKALLVSPYREDLEDSLRKRISQQSVEDLCRVDLYHPDTRTSHAKMEMLLSACKQIHKAGFLSSLLHSQDPSYAQSLESELLLAVYKGIAPGEERKALPSMDVSSRRLADGLVQLAFSLGGQSEQLVELLLNTIMLSVPLAGSRKQNFLSFSHGEYFYSLFQMTLNAELLSNLDTTVPLLMTAATQNPSMVSVLLNGMLDHSFRERSVRKSQGSRLVERILQRWEQLRPWWGTNASTSESKTATLTLLSKVLQIDSSVCSNASHQAFQLVFSTFTTLIVDMALPLNLKSQALIMLPFFTTLPEEPLAQLQTALEALVASHLPMQSDEFPRGSLHRNNYMDCLRKFLDALELSQSPLLLKLMAGVLCRDTKHIMEDLFQTCFQRIARRSSGEQLLCVVYKTIQQGDVPVPSMLQAMLERVLLPLASYCSPKALAEFFSANVSDIMAALLARFTKSNEAAYEAQLIKKNGCYKLMELLYSRLPKEEVYSKDSQINQAYLLSWIGLATPKGNTRDKVLANRLLEFLMRNSFHPKRPVFRHNLEIIRTVVECWKDCLDVPYNLIYERFCGTDLNSKDNSVGLQLLGIVLANNLPAYDARKCDIEYDRYIQSLTNNLAFTRYKEVYSAAAEIIGLILKNMTEKDSQPDASLLSLTVNKLTDLKKKDLDDKFIICLSKVSKHFPPVMDRFVNVVSYLLPKLHGMLKTHCLECVFSRADVIPDIYLLLKTKGFTQIMAHRDEARQRVCLDIIHKILARLKPVELHEVLGAVTAFISHPSPACRERMYDILMWIQDNYSDAVSQSDSVSVEVFNEAKETLLQGLTDRNQGLQLYVRNFWSHEKRLPKATLERMLALLHSLYSSRIEEHFLSLATNLLLEMTSQSPDYTRNMFEYPLSECKFQDYVIDSNWRLRSTVLTPMFVETQATQGPESSTSQPGSVRNQLRATQGSLEFSQTLAPGGRTVYNWLTGSSVDTLAEFSLSSESLSSLLVFDKKKPAAWRPTGEGFGTRRLTSPSDEGDSRSKAQSEQRADILRLRRRFLKDQEKVSLGFAKKEIRHQRQEKDKMADQRLRKEAQVTLYRSYRSGDLPDIQIQHSSLIAPLQALAQRDPSLAKQLFSSLFAGVLQEMEGGEKSNEEKKMIKEKLLGDMNGFLSNSTLYFPAFVACVQDMSYQHKDLLQIQPAAVSSSCLASLQQPTGILLLEEGLVQGCSPEEPPAKRARGGRKEVPPDTEKWIHLAKLYRSLGDYDVVRGIFGGKIGTKSITCTALQAEASSNYAEAVRLYNEALNTEWSDGEPTDTEKDFWEMAALEAYSHLTEWKSLQYCSIVNIDQNQPVNLDKMWAEPFYQETYLQYMMRSMLKQLQLGERDQALLSFVDGAMKVEERKALLESHYSQELSLLYILQEDYDRAKYYANNCLQVFMQNYSSVDTLLNRSRLTILQSVQALTEIQDFLQFITGEVSINSLQNLIRRWIDRYPDAKMDPMNVWDDIITSRCFFLDKICEKLSNQAPSDSMEVDGAEQDQAQDLGTIVKDCKFSMKLCMADSAWKQSNFPVATKLLKELHREAKTQRGWLLRWVHSFSRFSHKRSLAQGPVEQIGTMLKAIPLLDELQAECQSASGHVFRDQRILLGTSYHVMASAVSRSPSVLESIGREKADRVLQLARSSSTASQQKVEVGLQLRALELFSGAVRRADEEVQSYTQECLDTSGIVEAYMALANFCDQRLREEEQSSNISEFPELATLPVHVVESMLKALKLNSEEARLKFPRLLQIIELYPAETLDLMAKEMATVPCWQLIGWISQMMALLDKPEAVAVQHMIGQIAECYPQALVYPYMISSESYHFEDSASGHKHQEFVDRLQSLLDKGGAVRDFVDALQQLTNPEMLFKDWWDDVKNECEKMSFDKKRMRDMYEEMYSSLGDQKSQGLGVFRRKFIQKFAKEVEKLLGPGGAKLFEKRRDQAFLRQVEVDLIGSMRGFQREPGNLKEYSPWLSGFKADSLRNELEVPGQYDGRSKPLPEYHAKITGFDERVKVMSSIRRPKRLIVRGDDEREYPFLVKGGEDLRQDQRIEQLFTVMNIVLAQDATCAHSSMQLRTYQVVPITTRIGLIEWMENTCTLKDLLLRTRTEEEQKTVTRPNEVYENWLTKVTKSDARQQQGIGRYAESYKMAKRNETVNNFMKMEQLVPGDLLRRAFVRMSTTPEAFLSLRSHFTSSHALLCISQWLLGIGDRHLSNFMINMETGGMIGIDFGHAFGSATQFLPVPELMPFRLTRQFVNLMQPMKQSGLIQSVMVHSLRAYRANPELLLNTMDVFVKEPSLDWKNFELKQLKKGGTWTESVNTKEINWYPLQKVNFARRKLEGANPATITSEELKLGFEKNPAFKGMQSVALGSEEHNVRARLGPEGLSVENQVDCLLDQAMDPNILGRVWMGWEPWI